MSQTTASDRYTGEVAFIFAYDIAYDLQRQKLNTLLGHPVVDINLDSNKRTPRELFLYRAQMVQLPPMFIDVENKRVEAKRTLRLLPTGAVSVKFKIPFTGKTLRSLTSYHTPTFGPVDLQQEARKLAKTVQEELGEACVRPNLDLPAAEAYTVFCIHHTPNEAGVANLRKWLQENRNQIAALLTQEERPEELSEEEAAESTGQSISYYTQDIAVIDWDAALLVDTPTNAQEALYIIELANLQLAELEAYDRILDGVLDRAYRDLQSKGVRRSSVLKELKEIRIDMARFSDELSNATKFLGDWHYARLYHLLSKRFHLHDWQETITAKLRTLDDLYEMLKTEHTNRLMLILEATIVAFFLIEIIPQLKGMVEWGLHILGWQP